MRRPSSTSAAGITTTAPPVANSAQVSIAGAERDHQLGRADDRHDHERDHERGAGDQHRLAGGLEIADRRRRGVAGVAAAAGPLAVEAIKDQAARTRRRAQARSSSRARPPTGSSVITLPSSATSPKAASVLTAPTAVTTTRRDRGAQPDQQQQEQDPDRDQLVAPARFASDAFFSARSIDGWPVTYALTGEGDVSRDESLRSAAGRA